MRFHLIAMATAMMLASPTFAQTQCQGASRPIITLDIGEPQIVFDLRRSINDLTMQQRSIAGYRSDLGPTNGITRYRVSASYQAEMRITPVAPWCLSPTLIRLRAEIASPITVAIASNYDPRTCAFRAIQAHEMQHVQITRQTMQRVAHILRENLANHLENRFYSGPAPETAQRSFSADMQQFISWAVAFAEQELRQANSVIDTPESYRQLHSQCQDWSNQPP